MQLSPSPALSHIVKHFLILESEVEGMVHHRMFPDGNSGMVLHYGTPFIVGDARPRSFIYGQISRYHNLFAENKVGVLIVVFQPYGAYSLLGIPSHELTDEIIPLQDIWGYTANLLEEEIQQADDYRKRISLIENFLFQHISHAVDPLVTAIVKSIYQSHGMITVNELSNQLYTHERKLERKFREKVGISPKHFSNTIRLQYFLRLLRNNTGSLTDLAYESGYYDQAHLIREFKKHAGITPRQYISGTNPLAVNFIQFF